MERIAKKYQNAEEDMEEMISIGTIGLIKAVMTFQPENVFPLFKPPVFL